MKIIRAKDMGMCFGVRDALQLTDQIDTPDQVTVHGELVHNPVVIRKLADAGFAQAPEQDRQQIPTTPLLLITAHGVSDRERARLESHGKQLIDTTCPLVRRVHDAARELASEGRHVLIIGKPGHVEVMGIVDDLESFDVIPNPEAVRVYSQSRLGIVCQTTMPSELLAELRSTIESKNANADIRFVDTVCHPTKRRQQAMVELVEQVDAVVVVGGRNSNNTKRLAEFCLQRGIPALHVTCADELDAIWFDRFEIVGLTAGTSTLDETIERVHDRLDWIGRNKSTDKVKHGDQPAKELFGIRPETSQASSTSGIETASPTQH